LAKIATKEEIGRSWTIDDLADANEALDAQEEAMAIASKPSK